MNKDRQDAV
jgi:hypothetical protein